MWAMMVLAMMLRMSDLADSHGLGSRSRNDGQRVAELHCDDESVE
jgi:hypothetical protein